MSNRLLIEARIPLRWRDLDAFNHVNNATFLTYLEEARLQWFSSIRGQWFDEHHAPVVAANHLNYRMQLTWPGEIVVALHCEKLGNSSLTIAHRVADAAQAEKVYCDGTIVLVWIHPASGKPVSLPAAVRTACQ